MDLAIVGTGTVGRSLGRAWADRGHDVVYGSRHPEESAAPGGPVRSRAAAAAHGDVVVLAVPGSAVAAVAADLRESLRGAVVVDPTNTLDRTADGRSLADAVADAAPGARVVKAFNTVGAEVMADPAVADGTATMLVAGDDGDAVGTVVDLAADVGFDPVRAGDRSAAIMLEDLARLWIHLSRRYGREMAFRLLR
ncbi:MAG: NADPH-dependent F420 reductase [Halobacteriaceae archaeon]